MSVTFLHVSVMDFCIQLSSLALRHLAISKHVLHSNHPTFQTIFSHSIPFHTAYPFPFQFSPSSALHTNRGVIHQFMGDVTSAMEDYQRATTLDSHYFLAHFNAGNILFHQKLFKQVWVGGCWKMSVGGFWWKGVVREESVGRCGWDFLFGKVFAEQKLQYI